MGHGYRADRDFPPSLVRLKEQLEKLKRNQERRLARKNQKLGIPIGAIGVGGKRAVKTETVSRRVFVQGRDRRLTPSCDQTRVCGNCGQRGHMKTSKKLCPRWHEFNAVSVPLVIAAQS